MHPTERKLFVGIVIALVIIVAVIIWSSCAPVEKPRESGPASSPAAPVLDQCTVCGVCPVDIAVNGDRLTFAACDTTGLVVRVFYATDCAADDLIDDVPATLVTEGDPAEYESTVPVAANAIHILFIRYGVVSLFPCVWEQ